jgi:selenocysteine lyase/cysteine desulfurase
MDWEAVRQEFPITRNYNFQNHAGVAPLCTRAVEAGCKQLRDSADTAYLEGEFYRHADRVRLQAAALINANPDELTFVKNTSEGLSFVANGISWNTGDNIVTTNVEFPANVYPWQALHARGVELNMVMEEDGRIPLERIIDSINSRTRLVAISSVQFASGFRTDLATLGEYCTRKGVLLCVDAIQSIGAMPIDVKGMHIDFLSADGHKWLCGPEGLGIFFVAKELQGHLKPSCIGWRSVKNYLDFGRYNFDLQDNIRRYDSGSYNLTGIYALGASISLLQEIGIERITSRVLALTTRLVAGLRDKGYRVASSRKPAEASGIVAFTSDLHDHNKVQRHLQQEHRIVIAVRNSRLRSSPHFYNTEKEIDQLIEALPRH